MWIGPTMNRTKQLENVGVGKCFLGNHWCLMSLVTSWKKCWLNDSIIMLMVFSRRNACKQFFVLKPQRLHGVVGIFTYMDGRIWELAGSRVETLGRTFSFQCLGIQDVAPVDLGEWPWWGLPTWGWLMNGMGAGAPSKGCQINPKEWLINIP